MYERFDSYQIDIFLSISMIEKLENVPLHNTL